MTCDDVRPQLTAYLDGELEGDRGTVVRGHLRTCAACRALASDEAKLRDALRALPVVDPPPSLWANVQAQLAAAEVAESKRPAWRRAIARWTPHVPRFAAGGLLAAAAAGVLVWRAQRTEDETATHVAEHPSPLIEASKPETMSPTPPVMSLAPTASVPEDVTADLAAEPARITEDYAKTATELLALAAEARPLWSQTDRAAFDRRVATLRASVDAAAEGRPRQRAYRAMIRYLQGAVVRDEIALASGGTP